MHNEHSDHHKKHRRHHPKLIYLHIAEIIAVILSFLERSRIARFLTAKVGLDMVVTVTDRFGAPAGRHLSTFIAALIAEPMLIAAFLTVVFILCNIILHIVLLIRRR